VKAAERLADVVSGGRTAPSRLLERASHGRGRTLGRHH
jgi:hypothetical protein